MLGAPAKTKCSKQGTCTDNLKTCIHLKLNWKSAKSIWRMPCTRLFQEFSRTPNKVAVFQLQEMFKRLVDAVPEVGLSRSTRILLFTTIQHVWPAQVKFQLYSFNSLLPKYEEALEPSSWMDHTQVQIQTQRSVMNNRAAKRRHGRQRQSLEFDLITIH